MRQLVYKDIANHLKMIGKLASFNALTAFKYNFTYFSFPKDKPFSHLLSV